MKYLLIALVILFTACSATQPEVEDGINPPKASILVFGDSWGFLLDHHDTFDDILEDKGLSKRHKVVTLANSGTTTDSWTGLFGTISLNLYFTRDGLKDIQYVVISLGGNDLIDEFNTSLDEDERSEIYAEIAENYSELIAFFNKELPQAEIIIFGLDYPNFKESRDESFSDKAISYWENLGRPSSYEINTAIGKMYDEILLKNPSIKYSNNLGLVQSVNNPDLKTPKQFVVDYGGDVYADTPANYMEGAENITDILGLEYVDSIHLNKDGYTILANRLFDDFIELE